MVQRLLVTHHFNSLITTSPKTRRCAASVTVLCVTEGLNEGVIGEMHHPHPKMSGKKCLKLRTKKNVRVRRKGRQIKNATFHAKIIRMSRPLFYIYLAKDFTQSYIICEPPQTLISAPSCLMRNCWGAQQRRRLNNRGIM